MNINLGFLFVLVMLSGCIYQSKKSALNRANKVLIKLSEKYSKEISILKNSESSGFNDNEVASKINQLIINRYCKKEEETILEILIKGMRGCRHPIIDYNRFLSIDIKMLKREVSRNNNYCFEKAIVDSKLLLNNLKSIQKLILTLKDYRKEKRIIGRHRATALMVGLASCLLYPFIFLAPMLFDSH